MTLHSTTTRSPGQGDASSDDLRVALNRMRSYPRALEQGCGRLWTYVLDTHRRKDPAVPFLASQHLGPEADRDPDAGAE